jgi:hypothetical protein
MYNILFFSHRKKNKEEEKVKRGLRGVREKKEKSMGLICFFFFSCMK